MISQSDIDQIHLVWTKANSSLSHLLSINVVRTICDYLRSEFPLIPSITSCWLRVYHVERQKMTVLPLPMQFTPGAVYCFVNSEELLCAGGYPPVQSTWTIRIQTAAVASGAPLAVARAWPGIVVVRRVVYLFGGNYIPLRSSEKQSFSSNWQSLPPMNHPRYSFHPVHYSSVIYLPDAYPIHNVFEAFDTITEQYRDLSVNTKGDLMCGSLAFASAGELYLLTAGNCVVRWRIGREDAVRRGETIPHLAVAVQCPALVVAGVAYFTNSSSMTLFAFDIRQERVWQVSEFPLIQRYESIR